MFVWNLLKLDLSVRPITTYLHEALLWEVRGREVIDKGKDPPTIQIWPDQSYIDQHPVPIATGRGTEIWCSVGWMSGYLPCLPQSASVSSLVHLASCILHPASPPPCVVFLLSPVSTALYVNLASLCGTTGPPFLSPRPPPVMDTDAGWRAVLFPLHSKLRLVRAAATAPIPRLATRQKILAIQQRSPLGSPN